MIVQAKYIQRSWDNTHATLYVPFGGPLPGGLYELDLSNPDHRKLCDLKTIRKEFVFQFDRAATNNPASGLFFCPDCGVRSETLNAAGNHSYSEHKAPRKAKPAPEPEPEPEMEPEAARPPGTNAVGDMRGVSPLKCKGCGEPFANLNLLMQHKPKCPAAQPVVAQESGQEVADVGQADPA